MPDENVLIDSRSNQRFPPMLEDLAKQDAPDKRAIHDLECEKPQPAGSFTACNHSIDLVLLSRIKESSGSIRVFKKLETTSAHESSMKTRPNSVA